MMDPTHQDLHLHCSGPEPAQVGTWSGDVPDHGQVHIHVATLDALRHRSAAYLHTLDTEEQARYERFRFPADRERFLLAHGLLRDLLGRYLGLPPDALRMARGTYGKPYLPDIPLHFNLSDTKDALALAVGHHPLGLDLETMGRSVDHTAVAAHYFTAEERTDIAAAADAKRRFLELWTRKEAVLKASGVGIMDDLKVLRVDRAYNALRIAHPAFRALADAQYHVHTWHVGTDHLLSLACATAPKEVLVFGEE
jgi:4'-phosphopantetheinyl transferase